MIVPWRATMRGTSNAASRRVGCRAYPTAKTCALVSPAYFGVTSGAATLAGICHDHGIHLIVDAA